jgi:hypothetical protein
MIARRRKRNTVHSVDDRTPFTVQRATCEVVWIRSWRLRHRADLHTSMSTLLCICDIFLLHNPFTFPNISLGRPCKVES